MSVLNLDQDALLEAKHETLVGELAHLYLGHLGNESAPYLGMISPHTQVHDTRP
jgi:hypothetical protein